LQKHRKSFLSTAYRPSHSPSLCHKPTPRSNRFHHFCGRTMPDRTGGRHSAPTGRHFSAGPTLADNSLADGAGPPALRRGLAHPQPGRKWFMGTRLNASLATGNGPITPLAITVQNMSRKIKPTLLQNQRTSFRATNRPPEVSPTCGTGPTWPGSFPAGRRWLQSSPAIKAPQI